MKDLLVYFMGLCALKYATFFFTSQSSLIFMFVVFSSMQKIESKIF